LIIARRVARATVSPDDIDEIAEINSIPSRKTVAIPSYYRLAVVPDAGARPA
jgi:hypothetical protein